MTKGYHTEEAINITRNDHQWQERQYLQYRHGLFIARSKNIMY